MHHILRPARRQGNAKGLLGEVHAAEGVEPTRSANDVLEYTLFYALVGSTLSIASSRSTKTKAFGIWLKQRPVTYFFPAGHT